jgi:type IV pilus assembly protein PilM
MNLIPQGSGTRPRVACEIAPEGVVAARSASASEPLAAVARVPLAAGAVSPGLKPGNVADRVAVTTAIRRALEGVGCRANARGADVSVVIPDGAVRVLFLDFDTLPSKLSETLPIIKFRLKKLLPFEVDDAMVSYQILSQNKSAVRVLAVAMPKDVLAEYESLVREAGFEPGVVLPSTLATLAAVTDDEPTLLVNAGSLGITTAILGGGQLLLHRSLDLQPSPIGVPASLPPALFEREDEALPLVDRHTSAGEWAAQEALPEYGRNPYADQIASEAAVEDVDGVTGLPVPRVFASDGAPTSAGAIARGFAGHPGGPIDREAANVSDSPYMSPTLDADLSAELHNAILVAPTSLGTLTDPAVASQLREVGLRHTGAAETVSRGWNDASLEVSSEEISHSVSVAAAYFEDVLSTPPRRILSAGPLGAEALTEILRAHGVAQTDDLRVKELVESSALGADVATASVSRSTLAGVLGAVRG